MAERDEEERETIVEEDAEGDLCGHGTACAGIVRSFAPECGIFSVRVLGAGFTGSGPVLLAGLRWAVEQGFDVVNMSLSTTKSQFVSTLHELEDQYGDRFRPAPALAEMARQGGRYYPT